MAVALTEGGGEMEAGVPAPLLLNMFNGPMTRDATRHQMSVMPDGQRFLVRIAPGAVPGSAGNAAPRAYTVIDPVTGQVGGRGNRVFNSGFGLGAGAGRGFAAGAVGVTVIRYWTTIAAEK